jgi:hypothetical protein
MPIKTCCYDHTNETEEKDCPTLVVCKQELEYTDESQKCTKCGLFYYDYKNRCEDIDKGYKLPDFLNTCVHDYPIAYCEDHGPKNASEKYCNSMTPCNADIRPYIFNMETVIKDLKNFKYLKNYIYDYNCKDALEIKDYDKLILLRHTNEQGGCCNNAPLCNQEYKFTEGHYSSTEWQYTYDTVKKAYKIMNE